MKEWYKSRTLWFNVVYLLLLVFGFAADLVGYSGFEPSAEVVTIGSGILALINLVLRVWFTKEPIT